MKVHRDRGWDKGVYEIDIKSGERLVIESEHGEVIIDDLREYLNLFTVLEGRTETTKGDVTQVWEGQRLEFARFKNKRFINPV
jgi:hypothetical protein